MSLENIENIQQTPDDTTKDHVGNIVDKAKEDKSLNGAEKKKIQEMIQKQKVLIQTEINQKWKIIFGEELPKSKKEIYMIDNITIRNIWMETDYLFTKIKKLLPNENFQQKEQYALKWQPPGCNFRLIIPFDDLLVQENALIQISKMNIKDQLSIKFFFAPIDPRTPMFLEHVHPSSLISYRTKNEVLQKLCDLFLQGKMEVNEIQQIFSCGQDVWSSTVYNMLPSDEQIYHTYLNEKKDYSNLIKDPHKSYLDEEITLNKYEELKFPERKKLRDIEKATYPLPVEAEACIICGVDKIGIIQCQNCHNKVCKACVRKKFVDGKGSEGSFLLMHHRYCLKLGKLNEIIPNIMEEPGYLREFRETSRIKALEFFASKTKEDEEKRMHVLEPMEELTEMELELMNQELQRKANFEFEKQQRENPARLNELKELLEEKKKRFQKLRKDISELDTRIAMPGHTVQFTERNIRLRNERIMKLNSGVRDPIMSMVSEAKNLKLVGKFIDAFLQDTDEILSEILRLNNVVF